jgi:hypothetical protein
MDIPLDVLTKGFKIPLYEGYRGQQLLGQRTQIWQSFANAADQHIDTPQIDLAATFRPIAQTLAHALLDALLQGAARNRCGWLTSRSWAMRLAF